jgi:pilus assembly protein Flp/PilA
VSRFAADVSGATAIEYALIAVIVSIVIVPAIVGMTGHLEDMYNAVGDAFKDH